MGSDPFIVLSSRQNRCVITRGTEETHVDASPFDVLGSLIEEYHIESSSSPVPFVGGGVGYLSYDLCHFIERLPVTVVDDLQLPECYFAFYDVVLAYDHLEGKAYIVSTGFPELVEEERMVRARNRVNEMKSRLTGDGNSEAGTMITAGPAAAGLSGGFTHEGYVSAVEKARQYIIAGDIFEVNISQRFEAELTINPYDLYQRLRRIKPRRDQANKGYPTS